MQIQFFSAAKENYKNRKNNGSIVLARRAIWLLWFLVMWFSLSAHSGLAAPPAVDKHLNQRTLPENQSIKHESDLGKKITEIFNQFGPLSVFLLMVASGIGLHFPEDMIIIPAGWEIAEGHFSFSVTFFAAYFGVVLGDTGWFLLCRFFGTRLLRSNWLLRAVHPRRILEIKYLIDHYGAWVLVICRFIPGTRTPSLTVGGLMHLKAWVFLAVELPMVFLTVSAQLAIGFYAARGIEIGGVSQRVILYAGLFLAALMLIAFFIVRRRLASGKICLPRASMKWLRKVRDTSRDTVSTVE